MVFLACGDEPFGGGAFAIVLVVSVLLGDHLGCEGNDDVGVGMDKGSAHHRVRVGRGSVAVVGDTVGTVRLGWRNVPGPSSVAVWQLSCGRQAAHGRGQSGRDVP